MAGYLPLRILLLQRRDGLSDAGGVGGGDVHDGAFRETFVGDTVADAGATAKDDNCGVLDGGHFVVISTKNKVSDC